MDFMQISMEMIVHFLESLQLSPTVWGAEDVSVSGFCSLNNPRSNSLLWVKKPELFDPACLQNVHDCIIISKSRMPCKMENMAFIIVDNPKGVFFEVIKHFWRKEPSREIAVSAIVESKEIAGDVSIGHQCYIGPDVVVGAGTIIEANVSIINRVRIGENCLIHAGAVLGTDGYGYYNDGNGIPQKVQHFGGVKIGRNVEIGANTCVARGTIDDTIIEDNCKIDNLVQIAHNAIIHKNTMIVAGSIICGSVSLDEENYIGPGCVIKNQVSIGKHGVIAMGAIIDKDLRDESLAIGSISKSSLNFLNKNRFEI